MLEPKGVTAKTTIIANKEKFDVEATWDLLKSAASIEIAKGNKRERFNPKTDKEAILKAAIGPSGNLRAPSIRIGNHWYIGFNPEMYNEMIS